MRYVRKGPDGKTDTADWVVFKPGVARLTIAQVYNLSNTADKLAKQIEQCHFENDSGKVDALETAEDIFEHLTFEQFDWLGKRLLAFARDEALDPEV